MNKKGPNLSKVKFFQKYPEKNFNGEVHLFKSLFENHPDAVFSFDPEGIFISVNPGGIMLSEGSQEEILGNSFSPFIPHDDLPRVFNHFKKALKGETQNYITDFTSLKGNKKIIHVTNFPIIAEGRITGVFGIAKDITESELNKRKIEEGEQRYKKILDHSLDVICTVDGDGIYKEVSAACFRMWGYAPEEMVGQKYLNFVFEEDREKTEVSAQEVRNRIVKTNFTNRYVRKDGTIVPVIWSARWDENEKLMYCIAKDASEIEEAQKKVLGERNLLKSIIDIIPDYIFVMDKDQKTILTNKKFYSEYLGGDSESATLNKLPEDYFPEREGKMIMEDNRKILESGIPVINRKDIVYDHKGRKDVILLSKVPFKNEEGEVAGIVGIGKNITVSYNFEQEQNLIFQLIDALSKAPNLTSGLKKTIQAISEYFDFAIAEAWEVGYDSLNLRKIAAFGKTKEQNIIQENFKICGRNDGLAGIVWQKGTIEIWDDLKNEERFVQKKLLPYINNGIGVPLIFQDNVIAVLTFYGTGEFKHPEISSFLNRLSVQIATSIQRKITENQLNNMFKFSPNLIAVIGLNGYLKRVNPAFVKIFGYSEIELLSQPFKNFLHPDEIPIINDRLGEVASGLKPRSFQNRCLSKNGEWKWVSWTPSELIEEEGIVHLFGMDITPIKSAHLELLKYKNAIESAKDGIAIFTLETHKFNFNNSLKDLLGLNDEQISSFQSFGDIYGKEELSEDIVATLLAGDYWDGDIKLKDKSGKALDFWFSGGPIFNENRELIAIYGHHIDISERKTYENTLKQYNTQIVNILESITDGFFSITEDWKVTYWNKEAENLLGILRENVLNEDIREHFPKAQNPLYYKKYSEAFESGEKVSFEEYLEQTGKWIEVNAYPGKEGLSVYIKDISARKEVDHQIRIAKERYDLVSRATREAVYDWDISKNILIWSEAYFSVFGYNPGNNPDTLKDWSDNVFPEDKERVLKSLEEALGNPEVEQWELEYRMITGEKNIAEVIEKGFIIRESTGIPVRMIGSIRDITELKKKEKELEQLNILLRKRADELAISNAELEQFAYIASHDLQEPLRMITSFLSQLQKKYNEQLDDKARQYIYFANDGAVRMRQIILDLLEYSRIGRMDYKFEEVDLNKLVKEICLLQETIIKENGAQIIFKDLPVIRAAKTPLQRLLSNLINNAIKYRKKDVHPIVEISISEDQDFWKFVITDNGIGINPLFSEKIFEIFQRLHSRDKYSGTGIGLAVCKKIVENHGGTIRVTSQEDIGSEFHFTINKHF